MWDALGNIYKKFHEVLSSRGIAYEGMLYRHVIEHLDVEALPYERYVFIGFNVLNKVEQTLFKSCKKQEKQFFIGIMMSFT